MEFVRIGDTTLRIASIDAVQVEFNGNGDSVGVAVYTNGRCLSFGGDEADALLAFLAPGPATRFRLGKTIDITPDSALIPAPATPATEAR